jgi:rare lipoprotein A
MTFRSHATPGPIKRFSDSPSRRTSKLNTAVFGALLLLLCGCSSWQTESPRIAQDDEVYSPRAQRKAHRAYRIRSKTLHALSRSKGYREIGMASWYGSESGNRTASGARFNPEGLSAAHKTLPLSTKVRVTNLENGQSTVLVVNDRGPFVPGRIIDLSHGAARRLNMHRKGTSRVMVEALN